MSKEFNNTEFIKEDYTIDNIVNRMNIDDLRYLSKKYLILLIEFKKENIDLSQEMIKCRNPLR